MRFVAAIAILLFGRLLPKRAYPVVAGPLRGRRFILGAAAGPAGGVSIFAGRCEPAQTRAVARSLAPGDVFFDVGANVGYYTLLASERVGGTGRVVAFEPVVRNLSFLHRHLELNRASNVTVLPFACAAGEGYALFEGGDTVATGHLASCGAPSTSTSRCAMPVRVVTIDAMVEFLGLRPTVMKIDVEGAEGDVLRGATNTLETCLPRIFLSVHSDRLRADCLAFLRRYGYGAEPLEGEVDSATEFLLVPTSAPAVKGSA